MRVCRKLIHHYAYRTKLYLTRGMNLCEESVE
jgi:hypothetical protein